MKINDQQFDGTLFAYDGCHKIYLISNDDELQKMRNNGYDIHPIEQLPAVWEQTCLFRRFISSADLKSVYVEQCDTVCPVFDFSVEGDTATITDSITGAAVDVAAEPVHIRVTTDYGSLYLTPTSALRLAASLLDAADVLRVRA